MANIYDKVDSLTCGVAARHDIMEDSVRILVGHLDGTRAYLHAVIDNFSRRILSWRLTDRFDPTSTVAVLLEAGNAVEAGGAPPTVLADGGVENVNKDVDELIRSGLLRRVLAQTELRFSNSMVEAWWRVLKHQWLYLHHLDSLTKLHGLIAFYVDEHNSRLADSRSKPGNSVYAGVARRGRWAGGRERSGGDESSGQRIRDLRATSWETNREGARRLSDSARVAMGARLRSRTPAEAAVLPARWVALRWAGGGATGSSG